MIRAGIMAAALVALAGCDKTPQSVTPPTTEPPRVVDRSTDEFEATATALATDRARLDQVRAACKADAPEATPDLCEAAAGATRRRFRGKTDSYRPRNADPFPTAPVVSNDGANVPGTDAQR
jgi:hypothetical protein